MANQHLQIRHCEDQALSWNVEGRARLCVHPLIFRAKRPLPRRQFFSEPLYRG
jgi:hypothetical protein